MNSRVQYVIDKVDDAIKANLYVKGTKFYGLCRQDYKNDKKIPVSYFGNDENKMAGFDDKFPLCIYHRIVSNPNPSRDDSKGFGNSSLIIEETTVRMVVFGDTSKIKEGEDLNYKISEDLTSIISIQFTKAQLSVLQSQSAFIQIESKELDKKRVWEDELGKDYAASPDNILFYIEYRIRLKYLESCKNITCVSTEESEQPAPAESCVVCARNSISVSPNSSLTYDPETGIFVFTDTSSFDCSSVAACPIITGMQSDIATLQSAGYVTCSQVSSCETDPIFSAWLAVPPNISTFTNDAGYVTAQGLPQVLTTNNTTGGNNIVVSGGDQIIDDTGNSLLSFDTNSFQLLSLSGNIYTAAGSGAITLLARSIAMDDDMMYLYHETKVLIQAPVVDVVGDVNIAGNVQVTGTFTVVNTQTIQASDNNIVLNYGGTHVSAIGGGFTLKDGVSAGNDSTMLSDANGNWIFNTDLTTTNLYVAPGVINHRAGNIVIDYDSGNDRALIGTNVYRALELRTNSVAHLRILRDASTSGGVYIDVPMHINDNLAYVGVSAVALSVGAIGGGASTGVHSPGGYGVQGNSNNVYVQAFGANSSTAGLRAHHNPASYGQPASSTDGTYHTYGFGADADTAIKVLIKGIGATSGTNSFRAENYPGTAFFKFKDNGELNVESALDGASTGAANFSLNSTSGGVLHSYYSNGGVGTQIDFYESNVLKSRIQESAGGIYALASASRISFKSLNANTTKLWVDVANSYVGIGNDFFAASASLHVQGLGATSATYALKVDDSNASALFQVRNDGQVLASSLSGTGTRVIGADATGVLTASVSTTNLTEGTNLYYTQARFDSAFSAKALDDLSDVIISSPVIDQFLRYNGTNWVNGNAITTNAGNGVDFYFTTTASDISTYKVIQKTPQNAVEQDISATANNNSVLIMSYASDVAGLGGTQIDAGTWNFDVWGYVNIVGGGFTSSVDISVYSRTAAGTETLLFSVSTGTLTGVTDIYSIASVQQAFALSASTDRLVFKVYATTNAIINRTIHLVFAGTTHYSNVNTPLVIRHNDVAGLQGGTASQYYHLTSAEYTGTGTGNFVRADSPTITGHPTIEGVTSTGASGTGKFLFDNAPTITGHPTIEGVTSTGATGTGKIVFDASPTLSGTPLAPTATTNTNNTQIATTAYADAPINIMVASWVSILHGVCLFSTATAAASDVYFCTHQSNSLPRNAVAATISPAGVYLKSTDYPSVNGKTAKLRMKVSIFSVNDVAPGTSFTVGLYPVTAPTSGTTGAVGTRVYNAGTVVSGSNGSGMVFTTPAADSLTFDKYSATFSFPADGFYAIATSVGAALAANSACHMIAELQVHYE